MSETNQSVVSSEDLVWRDSLFECLDLIQSAGDFAVSHRHTVSPNPGLQIDGSRIISLPLTPTDAEAIKTSATQATYGMANQNIVDTTVRKMWELQPSKFQLANPEWESYFGDHILKRAADGLGLQNVTARLQKLLLYEKGSFFKPHKDSQTEAGMLGTLVVCLPSQHSGGQVHLSFGSEKRTLATDTAPTFDLTALAWFSDVTHEVAELSDGYRLVLTYHLVQTAGPTQSAQFFHQQLERLHATVAGWNNAGREMGPLYYSLDHLYSDTLSVGNMKGRDLAVCQVLHNACSNTAILFFLARIRHIQWHDDEGEGEKEYTTLDRVYTCDGVMLASKVEHVNKGDFLGVDPFDRDPDQETIGGYRVGYDNCRGNSKYYNTVAMLVPRQGLNILAGGMHSNEERDVVVSMVDEQLRKQWNVDVQTAAVKVLMSSLESGYMQPSHATQATVRTILHWALKWNDDRLYREVGIRGLPWLDTQETILSMVALHLQAIFADHSEIEWETWFRHFAIECSLATWQRIVENFPSHLEAQELQDSFKAWGQARLDNKFESQPELSVESIFPWKAPDGDCGDDCSFIIKSIESRPAGSDWVTTCLLPALATRGSRELQYKILDASFTRRESKNFTFAKKAFEYLIHHSGSELGFRATDLSSYDCKEKDRKAFLNLLDQCLIIGASDLAVHVLEASAHDLETKSSSIANPGSSIVSDLLVPLTLLLEKHGISDLGPPVKALFVTIIRRLLFRQLPKKDAHGFLGSYNEVAESLRSALAPLAVDIVRSVLGDACYQEVICLEFTKAADDSRQ